MQNRQKSYRRICTTFKNFSRIIYFSALSAVTAWNIQFSVQACPKKVTVENPAVLQMHKYKGSTEAANYRKSMTYGNSPENAE